MRRLITPILIFFVVTIAAFLLIFMGTTTNFTIVNVYATILEKESPPPLNQTGLTLSDDTLDTDISINVDDMEEDTLFENRTQMISTKGANDLDIDGLPPEGVTVIIRNDTVMVTMNPVTVEFVDEMHPYIIDEILDAAREQADSRVLIYNGTVTAPTIDLLATEAEAEEEDREEKEEDDDNEDN